MKEYEEKICLTKQGSYDVKVMSELLFKNITSRKKISRVEDSLKVELEYLIQMVNEINLLDEFDFDFYDVNIADVLIPEFLKQFIYPKKVAIDADNRAKDLRIRPELQAGFEYHPKRVREASERLYGTQKLAGKYVKLSEIRDLKLVKDIVWTCWNGTEWRVHSDSDSFPWPTPIDSTMLSLYTDSYVNESCNYFMFQNIIRWGLSE